MTAAAFVVLGFLNDLVLLYFLVLNSVYLATSVFAFRALKRHSRRLRSFDLEELMAGAGAPPVTLITPAFNEAPTCVAAVRSLLGVVYPRVEVLFVNDGSTDDTLARMIEAFELEPAPRAPTAGLPTAAVRGTYRSRRARNLWVVDKENGGKADALNAGINFASTPLFCAVDADSLLEREALIRLVRPFLEDGSTVAAGGIVRIANDCRVEDGVLKEVRFPRRILAQLQVLEYLRAFLSGRMGWAAMQGTFIISGAFGMFRRRTVVDAGGYSRSTVGEDMELVVRLHRYCRRKRIPYRIAYVPDPVAWTECPETLRALGRQRDRWQRGLVESVARYWPMMLNPRYGRIGLFVYPYFFFLEMLGPVIEMGGYVSLALALFLGSLRGPYVLAFIMVAIVLGMALSVAAVALEELSLRRYPRTADLVRLFALAFVENLGYRQLCAFWRFRGFLGALRGAKGWGRMDRRGFEASTA